MARIMEIICLLHGRTLRPRICESMLPRVAEVLVDYGFSVFRLPENPNHQTLIIYIA